MDKPGIEPATPVLQDKKLFLAFLGSNQFRRVGLRFVCWFYVGNTQMLTESSFMEKPGIEIATPGLQGKKNTFCGFPVYKPDPWFTRQKNFFGFPG